MLLSAFLNRLTHAVSPSMGDPGPCNNSLPTNIHDPAFSGYRGNQFAAKVRGSRNGASLLLFFALMFGLSSTALAGEFCSTFPDPDNPGGGLIDGSDSDTVQFFIDNNVTQITIDTHCIFRNWNPLTVTINFQTNDPEIFLITFDNVVYTGNMACANIPHQIWMVNGNPEDFHSHCQDLFIPVEAINKLVPNGKTTVGIGEVFTYTMRIPVMYSPVLGIIDDDTGSANDLHSIVIRDNLNDIGANLTLIEPPTVEWAVGSSLSGPVSHNYTNNAGDLTFEILPNEPSTVQVQAGDQIQVTLTLSVDSSNTIGNQFFNTATWTFGRVIELDPDDNDPADGDTLPTFFDPLPGQNGVSEVLTIGAPDLVVTKTSPDAALNIGVPGTFSIDVANLGNTDAWSPTIVDILPDEDFGGTVAGMCDIIPSNITVGWFEADGTTPVLPVPNQPVLNDDYTINFFNTVPPAAPVDCTLTLTFDSTGTNGVIIQPGQRLIITYNAELDVNSTADGVTLTNVAAATQWFSANPDGSPAFITFNPGIDAADPGTPGIIDNQDTHDLVTGLSGYFFTKTVENIETGEFPASSAVSGDTLRYTLRVFNVNQTIKSIIITDDLSSSNFNQAVFNEISSSGVTSANFDGSTLTINGNDLTLLGDELIYVFEIDVAAGLANGAVVSNQADLFADGVFDPDIGTPEKAKSDDPFVNSIDDPLVNPPDPETTDVTIIQPGPLLKVNDDPGTVPVDPVTEATIGDELTYTIIVPETAVTIPLYDVRIEDNMTAAVIGADLELVSASVVSGGSWTLTNTGSSNDLVLEDTGAGIDIPVGGQAVIALTVRVSNTSDNQIGDVFSNTATYTYNRVNNDPDSFVPGTGNSGTALDSTVITEPDITAMNKTANNTTPTAGEIVRYSIELTAAGGGIFRDVFDVTLTDTLDPGLVYVGNATVTIGTSPGGSGVADDNTISDPDVTGDGITTQQILDWTTANSNIDIDAGETVIIEYDVQVLDTVLANQTLNNSVIVQWTGIDGVNIFERTGIDGPGGALNDYAIGPAVQPLTIQDIVTTIDKVRSSDTFNDDGNVRIGDVVEYTLTIPVPEGTLGNLTLVDTLPVGLAFESIVSINTDTITPYGAVAPFSYTDIPDTNVVAAGNTVTWNLGNITNLPLNNTPDDFVIVYTARVLNGDVLNQQDNTLLNNQIQMFYDTAAVTGALIDSDIITEINVLQPNLSITKSASPDNGDIFIDAAEVITYTVDITNNGTAPAYDPVIQDVIPDGLRTAGISVTSITLIGPAEDLADIPPVISGVNSEIATWDFDDGVTADTYTIDPGQTLRIEYTVTADNSIAQGLSMTNTASVLNYYSLDDDAMSPTTALDSREVYPDLPAVVSASTTLYTEALPTKALITPATATIGEIVEYQITVPGVLNSSSLFDVQITDTLDANLELINVNIVGGIGVTDNSVANPAPSLVDISVGEITANTQVVINVQARVRNVTTAQEVPATAINNTVSYTYAFAPAGAQQPVQVSTDIVTVDIVEPLLTVAKAATPITSAPITGGDILEYVLTIPNTGGTTAFDVNIVDTLPAGLALDASYTPTAILNVSAPAGVLGFNPAPAGAPGSPLIWGRDNGDESLDIPPGDTLILTYRVLIDAAAEANVTLSNSVLVDWTSLNTDLSGLERTGVDGIGGLNDYITVPATADTVIEATNTIAKAVIADSFGADDGQLRVGDTVNYELQLNLQEGTTRSVVVDDVLDAGLEFVGIVSINGDTTSDYTAPAAGIGSNFNYAPVTAAALPAAGQAGTLTFTIGDVANDPLGDPNTDTLTIIYQARVAENTIAQAPATLLDNNATLNYLDGANVSQGIAALTATATALQPVMSDPTKVDAVFTSGDIVDVANDTMQFTVESCNNGDAPAYDFQLTDVLPWELDENTLTAPVVAIYDAPLPGGALQNALTDGTHYDYVGPAGRGDSIVIDLSSGTPVNPAQCLRVSYNIGFYTDFGSDQTWSNSVTVNEYWSLPAATGQRYGPSATAQFIMTNGIVAIDPPAKIMTAPLSGEATIGEQVVYQIAVPGTVANAALFDVVLSDTLHASLVLESVDVVDNNGSSLTFTDNTSGNNISLAIDQIIAGQQAVVTLTARVNNNASADANTSFTNTASYTFETVSGGTDDNPGGIGITPTSLLIVEPTIGINKIVANQTSPGNPPTAGDILHYTVTLTASGGVLGDQFSDAFDATIIDDLSLGLAYVATSSTVDGGNTISDPAIVGDGIATPQTLTWQLADATADINIPENTTVIITYDVIVLDDVVAGQDLTNSALAQWTGLDGVDANERTGTSPPVENDYFTAPFSTTVTVPDNTLLAKSIRTDTSPALTAANDVRVGDIVEYELRLTLQEGVTRAVVLSDTLPPGMVFEGVAEINGDTTAPFSSASPFTHAEITPSVAGNTVTFTIGDITNAGDNNPANDDFVIIYHARVLDKTLAQTPATQILSNNAVLNYTTLAGLQTQNVSVDATLQQPFLSVSKSHNDADGTINAGDIVNYTVTVSNIAGTAPAYDVVVEDLIPVGMRNGAVTITPVSTTVNGGGVANVVPSYDAVTGLASWNFDNGVTADTYTIFPGQTLTFVYQVQADADLGAGLTLANAATAMLYYSFDDDDTPVLGGATGVAEIYGPSNTAITTLTSPTPGALLKQTPLELSGVAADQFVAVGDTFTYRITVPATSVSVALNDVRIFDDLSASAANLSFVSVTSVGGPYTWIAENTGNTTNLVIEDPINGIDIPANGQIVLDITVQVEDTVTGTDFINTANYTYDGLPVAPALADDSGIMTIVGPEVLIMTKTGPATVRFGTPAVYTLDLLNDNTSGFASPAWDITITDNLADLSPAAGGMCDAPPVITLVGIYDSTGTVLQQTLNAPADYSSSFAACTLIITTTGALPADNILRVVYQVNMDVDTPPNTDLSNIAGATEWFSNDNGGRSFTEILSTDPVVAAANSDFEDSHTVTSEVPIIEMRKLVDNLTTGLSGANASPGDTLHYTIEIDNISDVSVADFSFVDDLDALNTIPAFLAGSLENLVVTPAGGDDSATDANGGDKVTGLVSVTGLALSANTGGVEMTIEFDVTLQPVITSGTVVLNQGQMTAPGVGLPSDDPNIGGATDATETLIASAPLFEVFKTSADITGDPAVLVAGDTLRYTITVKNIGLEDSVDTLLSDQIPLNTTYVPFSTTLNGDRVTTGVDDLVSALESGMQINAPENTTAGEMRADIDPIANNVATITFEVTVNASAVAGTVISNQGFVTGDGIGSGAFPQQPSDDPATPLLPNDPTLDVVGSVALFDVQKTVALVTDANGNGIVDIGDELRYTITTTNFGTLPITNVVLTDAVPVDTTYVANSVFLNDQQVSLSDGGVSPLAAGFDISSSDLTPPLPAAGAGTLTAGQSAVVTFDVVVNGTAIPGTTVISNQGVVSSNELPDEPTDVDGIDSNGDQPTDVTVGDAPLISITKQVFVVGGGAALAGGELEYVVRVTNTGIVAVSNVVITDDLVVGQMTYVVGSGLLNGLPVILTGPALSADYSAIYGDLPPAAVVELRFRVQLDAALIEGNTVTNTGEVSWNVPPATASADVSIDIGGIPPGTASLNGTVWHDTNFNETVDGAEPLLQSWRVELYSNNVLLANILTNASGEFQFAGLAPGSQYGLRYIAPGAVASTATLGNADSAFTNAPQEITNIVANSGDNLVGLNLPIQPNGVVYNSRAWGPAAGVRLTMINRTQSNQQVPDFCFADKNHANQVTTANGFYKFDLNFSDPSCAVDHDYEIQVQPLSNNYIGTTSVIIPPVAGVQDVTTCSPPMDQIGTTAECENSVSEEQPLDLVTAAGAIYYLQFTFNADIDAANDQIHDQIYNNHIPVDPDLGGANAISKVAGLQNVTRGQLVPYTITVTNIFGEELDNLNVIDNFPAGFRYVTGSSRLDGVEVEPLVNDRQLTWDIGNLVDGESSTIKLLLVVGSGVGEGEYVNTAHMIRTDPDQDQDPDTNAVASGVASATVRVIPDPSFDCTDIIGKVFDDKNMNAYQDEGETGLPGVQVATARGLRVTTDQHGRFHITCAAVPNEVRGSNFIMKLDDRSLPSGYRITSENPRVQRVTRGKMMKFNFGAAIHRVVRLDLAEGVFEKGSTELRPQWRSRIDMLIIELQKDASVLRLSYLGENETESEVEDRLDAIEELISDRWQHIDCCYKLTIEKEVFWRKGNPSDRKGFE